MKNNRILLFISLIAMLNMLVVVAQDISVYNQVWKTQSIKALESMPCGGGDVGLNVWVEKGDVLFYVSQSGACDENNGLLKFGRMRVKLSPNPFEQNPCLYVNGEYMHQAGQVIDDNPDTKWFVASQQAWALLEFNSEVGPIDSYELTSANDRPGRDPKNWTLSGSNDSVNWTVLDQRNNEDFPERFQTRRFTIQTSNAYRYYRFNFENSGDPEFQLAEISLLAGNKDLITTAKEESGFQQTLKLKEGYVEIIGKIDSSTVKVDLWVDTHEPVVHVDVDSEKPVSVQAHYESWRTSDREQSGFEYENNRSFIGSGVKPVVRKDSIVFKDNDILVCHRNDNDAPNAFDLCVEQQGLTSVKGQMWNPIKDLTSGGLIRGNNMEPAGNSMGRYASADFKSWILKSKEPAKSHGIDVYLHIDRTETQQLWQEGLDSLIDNYDKAIGRTQTLAWWNEFWNRSYIMVNPSEGSDSDIPWTIGRNYQLFRYQLGCNAYGEYPTKFNGGLFTTDPEYVNSWPEGSPDYRRWGGGSFVAQNQRLVYWPMIKSGDFDMMLPQFDFYIRPLKNAELRTKEYWGHNGASFTEQMESFGLPVGFEYGWNRPADLDPGIQHSDFVDYQWDNALEFCWMILEYHRYSGEDISKYMPLIESCLVFYDEQYQMRTLDRTQQPLDENGDLVIYPGTACETYKVCKNPVTTVTALRTVITGVLELPDSYLDKEKRDYFKDYLDRVPPITFREKSGYNTIAPAEQFERIQNVELPQLYPVFPYGIYGVGLPDLEVAVNTWKYGADLPTQKDYISWHQDAIFCARLGLTSEAVDITIKKMKDSGRRFPTFWGPGHDWVPDHNWGGSGMIGLQEMLMQTVGDSILLFPAWPKEWDVDFKLHAPNNTIVEAKLRNGNEISYKVLPEEREKDVIIAYNWSKKASNPVPGNYSIEISSDTLLQWNSDSVIDKHNIYFGTTTTPSYITATSDTSYNPGALLPNTTYYWRIDEVFDEMIIQGTLWNFKTKTEPSVISRTNTQNQSINVYPQPVKDILTIEGLDKKTKMEIYDQVGQKIFSDFVHTKINISHLMPGLYIVKIEGYNPIKIIKK